MKKKPTKGQKAVRRGGRLGVRVISHDAAGTGPIETSDEAHLDRVYTGNKHDRNCRGR